MAITLLLTLMTAAQLASGRQFNIQNNLGYTVWVGILGNSGKGTPNNGGFRLDIGQRVSWASLQSLVQKTSIDRGCLRTSAEVNI
jgi:hypothetical protein